MHKAFIIILISNIAFIAQAMEMEQFKIRDDFNICYDLKKAIERNKSKKIDKIAHEHPEILDVACVEMTPLGHAAFLGKDRALKCLILHGCDVNKKDLTRKTPLMQAAWVGNLNAAKLLVSSGADILAKSEGGNIASQIANTGFRYFQLPSGPWPTSLDPHTNHQKQHNEVIKFLSAPFRQEILLTKSVLGAVDNKTFQLLTPDLAILCIEYACGPQARKMAYKAEQRTVRRKKAKIKKSQNKMNKKYN
jgi:hypothetical protein